jgi:hypothetical protein
MMNTIDLGAGRRRLYGFSNSILTAMRFRTGELWRHRSVGKGSLIVADKFLYC